MSLLAAVLILASGPPPANEHHVAEIEINVFGDQPRAALLFREADGRIMDWRWLDDEKRPIRLTNGKHLVVWREGDRLIVVITERLTASRTRHDVELEERQKWPEWKRRKLR